MQERRVVLLGGDPATGSIRMELANLARGEGYHVVSVGSLLESAISTEALAQTMRGGNLVLDCLVAKAIEEGIPPDYGKLLIDGAPRTLNQCLWLNQKLDILGSFFSIYVRNPDGVDTWNRFQARRGYLDPHEAQQAFSIRTSFHNSRREGLGRFFGRARRHLGLNFNSECPDLSDIAPVFLKFIGIGESESVPTPNPFSSGLLAPFPSG